MVSDIHKPYNGLQNLKPGPVVLQWVPTDKIPPCIRNRSQFSYKTVDKTIGYCSKTIGRTEKLVSYSREPAVWS